MKKKGLIFVFFGIVISIFAYYIKNSKKVLIYATYSMPQFELDNLNRAVKVFSEKNPGVTIKLKEFERSYLSLKDGINDLNEPIDVFLISYPMLPVFAKTKLIVPITEYTGIESSKESPWEGYGYPRKDSPYALLFNNDFLKYAKKKNPKTRDEFYSILQNLADKGVEYPFVIDTFLEDYFKDPVLSEIFLENIKKKGIDFYNELFHKKLIVNAKDLGFENRYEAFLGRKAAFIISTVEGISYIENEDSSLNFSSVYFPVENEGNYEQALDYNRYVVGKNSKNPELAVRFIEFLNNQD